MITRADEEYRVLDLEVADGADPGILLELILCRALIEEEEADAVFLPEAVFYDGGHFDASAITNIVGLAVIKLHAAAMMIVYIERFVSVRTRRVLNAALLNLNSV